MLAVIVSPAMDFVMLWLNIIFVTRAIYFNVTEGINGFEELRPVRVFKAGLATIYLLSYMILATGVVDRAEWSRIMFGLSPVVWEMVWGWPARRARQIRIRMVDSGVTRVEDHRRSRSRHAA